MTDIEKYAEIYSSIFGESFTVKDPAISNNCIGAIASDHSPTFTRNFIDRLNRLHERFKDSGSTLDSIKNATKDIATKKGYKWSGPYSELVALDFWQSFKDIREIEFPSKGPVGHMPDSLAKQIGQNVVDLDLKIRVKQIAIYMDVKSFIPTHKELIDRIIDSVNAEIDGDDYFVTAENLGGGDYLSVLKDLPSELGSGNLKSELIDAITNKRSYLSYASNSGIEYEFRISYKDTGRSIHVSEDHFNPYQAAARNKYKVLEYYNKLLTEEPTLLIFVLNPWFNEEMLGDLGNANEVFYRSLARRVFIELKNDQRDLKDYIPTVKHSLTVSEISKKISGILFIEDHSITKTGKELYTSYLYLNPNATNRVLTTGSFHILDWSSNGFRPKVIDDFKNDNY